MGTKNARGAVEVYPAHITHTSLLMISMIHIIKGVIYLGAAIALLRSVAALLPNNNDQRDIHGQLLFQQAKGATKRANIPAASTDDVKAEAPVQRFGANLPQAHDVASPDSKHTSSLDNINLTPPPQAQKPHFTIGSPTSQQWAITYTPYTNTLTCLSPSAIRSDIATIARKGFTSIRLYSIDCSALRHVGQAALTHGLKMIIGIPLDAGLADAELQLSELIDWASDGDSNGNGNDNDNDNDKSKWDLIELIVIGNEAIFNEQTTAPALATLITTSRLTLHSAGYTGPITTTEPLSILSIHAPTLCPTLSLLAANIQPFFHPSVTAATAGVFVVSELGRLSTLCPGLGAVSLETGWPSRGRANGEAVPGYLEQWMAVAGIMEGAGGRSVVLGFGDEGWKDEGEFGVEGSWGCGHVFGE